MISTKNLQKGYEFTIDGKKYFSIEKHCLLVFYSSTPNLLRFEQKRKKNVPFQYSFDKLNWLGVANSFTIELLPNKPIYFKNDNEKFYNHYKFTSDLPVKYEHIEF